MICRRRIVWWRISVQLISFLIGIARVEWLERRSLVLMMLRLPVAYAAIHHPPVVCERRLSLLQASTSMPVASEKVEKYGSEDHADDCIPNGHASITPPPALIAIIWEHVAVINVIVTALPLDQLFRSSPRHSHCDVVCCLSQILLPP